MDSSGDSTGTMECWKVDSGGPYVELGLSGFYGVFRMRCNLGSGVRESGDMRLDFVVWM